MVLQHVELFQDELDRLVFLLRQSRDRYERNGIVGGNTLENTIEKKLLGTYRETRITD